MKKFFLSILYLMIGLIFIVSCSPQTSAPVEPAPADTVQKLSKPSLAGSWQEEWDKTVAIAQKENNVVIYSSIGTETRQALMDAFKKKYGINLQITTGRGAEISQKLLRERQANINLVDAYIGGVTDAVTILKPGGYLKALKNQLLLPEVTDLKAWWRPDGWPEGELLWVDKEKQYILSFLAGPQTVLAVNTDQVKTEEITSYRHLLNAKWKGRIVMNDPTITGSGLVTSRTIERLMGRDFMVQLANQAPTIVRDQRLQAEWLARGKFSIAIGPKSENIGEFKDAGSPLMFIAPLEGVAVTGGSGTIALIDKAPHPNAARLFINWLLSKEGQAVISRALFSQSARLDVSADFLDAGKTRQPGEKYFYQYTEEFLLGQNEAVKRAQDIFGHLLR